MKIVRWIAIALAACTGIGCSVDAVRDAPVADKKSEALSDPLRDELFAPFQGQWKLQSRTFDPPMEVSKISGGPDLHINGHVIQIDTGTVSFRLCQARPANGGIEADALRVDEDEPGEVNRFECKLKLVGENLEFRWRAIELDTSTNDPIIAATDYAPPNRPLSPDAPWWIELYSKQPGE